MTMRCDDAKKGVGARRWVGGVTVSSMKRNEKHRGSKPNFPRPC